MILFDKWYSCSVVNYSNSPSNKFYKRFLGALNFIISYFILTLFSLYLWFGNAQIQYTNNTVRSPNMLQKHKIDVTRKLSAWTQNFVNRLVTLWWMHPSFINSLLSKLEVMFAVLSFSINSFTAAVTHSTSGCLALLGNLVCVSDFTD